MPILADSAPVADSSLATGAASGEPVSVRNCSRIGLRANPPRRRLLDLLLRAPRG